MQGRQAKKFYFIPTPPSDMQVYFLVLSLPHLGYGTSKQPQSGQSEAVLNGDRTNCHPYTKEIKEIDNNFQIFLVLQ